MTRQRLSIWLPSPLGDAILSTPALRAIRRHFADDHISFIATPTVKAFLTPSPFNDEWIVTEWDNPLKTSQALKQLKFDTVILFKNSFSSALAAFMAGIPERIGYARDGRGALLTEKLYPKRTRGGKFKPGSMIDYYLTVAGWLGCETSDRRMELFVDDKDVHDVAGKIPAAFGAEFPVIVLVPGGAFGPSKLWPYERYAQLADRLIEKYRATVIVSVAPTEEERRAAETLCAAAKNKLYSLTEFPLSPGQLKALIAQADLVIGNDTGPRHIAASLGRKVVTLFGPNNWNWTETGYPDEIKISAHVHCSPCDKPVCTQPEHYCMQAITVDRVIEAADELLGPNWEKH